MGTIVFLVWEAIQTELNGGVKTAAACFFAAWAIFAFIVYLSDLWVKSHKSRALAIFITATIGVGVFLFWRAYLPNPPREELIARPAPTLETRPAPIPAPAPQELHGLLIPANEPMPKHKCGEVPHDAFLLVVGGTLYSTKNRMQVINMYGYELLSIARAEGEGLNVSARVLSEDNKVVAQITNNEFYVNPPQFPFQLNRPDWHTLIVSDNRGREALYVHYANPKAVIVRGRFYTPAAEPVVATEDRMRVPGGNVVIGGCFGGGIPSGMVFQ